MLIIVEGFDNSGKSTLVSQLAEEFKLVTMNNRCRPTTEREAIDYTSQVQDFAANWGVIVDRWSPISEPIYGPICRGTHLFKPETLKKHLEGLDALLIYCRPSEDKIMNFGDRPQMKGVIEHAPKLLAAYDSFMGTRDHIRYDWNYASLRHKVNNYLEGNGYAK